MNEKVPIRVNKKEKINGVYAIMHITGDEVVSLSVASFVQVSNSFSFDANVLDSVYFQMVGFM